MLNQMRQDATDASHAHNAKVENLEKAHGAAISEHLTRIETQRREYELEITRINAENESRR